MRYILVLLLLLQTGCASFFKKDNWEQDATKWALPASVAAAYFGSVGWHEGGHALTGIALGADQTDVSVLPTKDDEGNQHLGLTTIRFREGSFSDTDITLYRTMGPTANFVGHVGTRELLKSGYLPKVIQPTVAWFSLFNQISYYYHTISGIARKGSTDLGKEERWIAISMFAGGILYDIYDMFFSDNPEQALGVLFGEKFYEPNKELTPAFRLVSAPTRDGAILGVVINW